MATAVVRPDGIRMNIASVTLAALNLAVIGLLPRVFFRSDGRLNARWWLTATPFFATGVLGFLAAVDVVAAPEPGYDAARAVTAAVLHAVSIGMIALTVGSHRIPLALWHQDDDAPRELVTWGPYRHVRHPFYAAFVLCLAGALVTLPHPVLGAIIVYAIVALDLTARREESRLLSSDFGHDYQRYMQATGRLVPMIGRSA